MDAYASVFGPGLGTTPQIVEPDRDEARSHSDAAEGRAEPLSADTLALLRETLVEARDALLIAAQDMPQDCVSPGRAREFHYRIDRINHALVALPEGTLHR